LLITQPAGVRDFLQVGEQKNRNHTGEIMRSVLAATIIMLVSADARAYTFALSKEQRARTARYCFHGFDGCMRRVLREQTSNTTWLLPVGGPVECGTRCTDKTRAGLSALNQASDRQEAVTQ
jgi:hypothetical protein